MGWKNAVGVIMHLHRNMLRRGTALPKAIDMGGVADTEGGQGLENEEELRRDRPVPLTALDSDRRIWQVYVDDFILLEVVDRSETASAVGTVSDALTAAKARYAFWGAAGNDKKEVRRQLSGAALGAEFGPAGDFLDAPKGYALELVSLTAFMCQLPTVPKVLAQVVAGR